MPSQQTIALMVEIVKNGLDKLSFRLKNGLVIKNTGLCFNFSECLKEVTNEPPYKGNKFLATLKINNLSIEKIFNDLFIDLFDPFINHWKHFSGKDYYPVPDPKGLDTPEVIYSVEAYKDDLYNGEYGKLRLELFNFICEQFKVNPELTVQNFFKNNSFCIQFEES